MKKLIIIDSSSIIHRTFHALPPFKNKEGKLVNAVYGFFSVLLKSVQELDPDFIATCFDLPEPTFRHKKFKEYKSQRPPTPKELYEQEPIIKDLLRVLKIPIFEKKGFEADDLIGTISRHSQSLKPKKEVVILSGDLDILQLIEKNVQVYILKTKNNSLLYNKEKVQKKYSGLLPCQLADYRGLRGDPSDNIPGVSGIGQKTAIKLLNEFHDLENVYKACEKNKINKRIRKLLLEEKEKAFLSRELAEIKKDVPLKINYQNMKWGEYKPEEVRDFLKKIGFKSLIKRFDKMQEKNSLLKLL